MNVHQASSEYQRLVLYHFLVMTAETSVYATKAFWGWARIRPRGKLVLT